MITRTFIAEEHEEFGTLGLRLVDKPEFDPLSGMAVAHDILEHPVRDNGTFEHELMALGASLFVRDESNYYAQKGQRYSRPSENLSSDMVDQFNRHGRDYELAWAPKQRKQEEWVEDEIRETAAKSVKLLLSEVKCVPEWLRFSQRTQFCGWMRAGYVAVRRRFRGCAPYHLCGVFMEIERRADRVLQHAYEGQQFKFSVDVPRGRVEVTEVPDPYDY